MDDERAIDEFERLSDIVIRNKHPNPPSGSCRTSWRISPIAIGSIPAKGSSRSMNWGRVARALAISTRRRSPPESATAGACRRCETENSSSNSRNSLSRRLPLGSCSPKHGTNIVFDRKTAKDRAFLGEISDVSGRALTGVVADLGVKSSSAAAAMLPAKADAIASNPLSRRSRP